MPQNRKKPGDGEPIDFLIERTLLRPRDVIDFLNRCFDETHELTRLSLADIRSAEIGYSEARLQGILDEWGNSYSGLKATFPLIAKLGSRFTPSQITDEDLLEHVSKMPPECDPEAGEVNEGVVNGEQMLVTNQQSAKLPEPCIGSFHDPSALVAAELAAIFIAPKFVVLSIWGNQFDTSFLEPLSQRVGVVAAVSYDALRLLPWAAFRPGDADFGDCGLRKVNFARGGTFQPNSHRKTFTVDQYHPLRPLATLGFANCGAPFFAGAKLPSKKVSSHLSRPRSSSAPSSVRHAFSQTPCSCHRCNRRQQVEGEGNSSGKNRHAAPVCRTQSMPSRQARFAAGGRPRPSRRRFGLGSKGSINFHCSSVNSFCRFFIAEAQQPNHLKRKCLT